MFGPSVVVLIQLCARVRARLRVLDDKNMEFENDFSLKEWAKDKPLSILQLDPADRAVLRIAGQLPFRCTYTSIQTPYGKPSWYYYNHSLI